MPELPEVENLLRYLVRAGITGRRIAGVDVRWPGVERSEDRKGGLAGLPGRRIKAIERLGKQLLVGLDRGVLGLHMGMTGSLAVRAPDEAPLKYAHTVLYLDDERRIELDDPRRWASVVLVERAAELTGGLGPDAVSPSFTADEFIRRVSPRRSAVKAVLLDQHALAGVGNIYADEALFRAGISPVRRADKISEARLRALHSAVQETLRHATEFISAHLLEDGRPAVVDAHDARMRLPRKKGAPCPDCGVPLRAHSFGTRTAYYCLQCQR